MRTVVIKVPDDVHRDMKIQLAKEGKTIQDHVLELIKKSVAHAKDNDKD